VPSTLATLLDKYSGDWGPQNIGGKLLWEYGAITQEELDKNWGMRPYVPSEIHLADLVRILDLLTVCRQTIGSIVRETGSSATWSSVPLMEGSASR